MEEIVPSQVVDQANLHFELFDQVIIPPELVINAADLISIAIRDAEIPLRATDVDEVISDTSIPQTEPTTPTNTLKCKVCPFTTSYKEYLTRHKRSHNAKQFSCQQCDYKTNSESGFKNHRLTHEARFIRPCRHKYCPATKCRVEAGRKKYETVIKRLFSCEACDYVTQDNDLLLEHTKQHCYDLEFNLESESCVICKMRIVKSLMNEHMKMHSPDE